MAKKADFNELFNIQAGDEVSAEIETATQRKGQSEITPEELQERTSQLRTQGRKGAKLDRLCVLISPENHDYIRVMSRLAGMSMTQYFDAMITSHRKAHKEEYEAMLKLRTTI